MADCTCQVEVDRVTPAEWEDMLDLFVDANIYQTWSYGGVHWGRSNLSHLVWKRDGKARAIAQLRIMRPAGLRFGVAYLRWGPLWERRGEPLDSESIRKVARALHEEYVEKRGLLLRVLPNAFVGSSSGEFLQSAFSDLAPKEVASFKKYRTFLLDLSLSVEELRRRLDKKWRNQLSRSEKNGLGITIGSGPDQYRTFCEIYNQMRKRKTFESNVDIEEFGIIQADLPWRHRMQVLICKQKGVPVAGMVTSAMGNSGIYLLGATSDDGLSSKGAYLLQWTMIQRLKEEGFRWYDLGGIDPDANPGVFHFKSGLSGMEASHVNAMDLCNSRLKTGIVRAAETLQGALHGCKNIFRSAPIVVGRHV